MKLVYRNTECTFVQFLSAVLATSTASTDSTLAIVVLLIEIHEHCASNGSEFRISDTLAKIIGNATNGQCVVVP